MKRGAILLAAVLLFAVPAISHAQASALDSQNRNEYSDDDSQVLNLVSYVLAPIGFVLEWTVARPLHYLATQSPAAPLLGANVDTYEPGPLPIQELPPPDFIESAPKPQIETEIVPGQPSAETTTSQKAVPLIAVGSGKPAPAAAPSPPASQPILH
jgi:hypothetical protein